MEIAVALLTCDRYDYTERVLDALVKHNDLSGMTLIYADDNSKDERIHELAASYGFEPVYLNQGIRKGCSPMTEALWKGARERIGDDGVILSLQNDFECTRRIPWELIQDALARPEVVCVKLWDKKLGNRMVGPRTKLLRKATWKPSDNYSEPVTVARTGWGFGPHAVRAELACKIVRNASREYGVMKQAHRLQGMVVRPEELSFQHIGKIKTPRGIYISRRKRPRRNRMIIASVTTTGRRISRVVPALLSIRQGTIQPDKLILWLNRHSTPVAPGVNPDDIPAGVEDLCEVRWCENYGPATKLLPSMKAFPEAAVATFDDDKYYPEEWLEGLVNGVRRYPNTIVCYRAKVIQFDDNGACLPYRQWPLAPRKHTGPDRQLLPTGVGGVIYPPRCMKPLAFDLELLQRLSLPNDDLWFAATRMVDVAVVPGAKPRDCKIGGPRLSRRNLKGRNDMIIKALEDYFGPALPWCMNGQLAKQEI